MEAQVWMTGRVGGDVDVRESASSPWSTFRLACTPRVVRGGEWGDEQTTWVTVSCSHRLAEHVRLSLRKGDPVVVVGKLRTRRWFDANGLEHEQLQIRASSVGHDLAIGTSSFYRPRRDAEGRISESAPGPDDHAGGTEPEDFVDEPADDEAAAQSAPDEARPGPVTPVPTDGTVAQPAGESGDGGEVEQSDEGDGAEVPGRRRRSRVA